MVNVSCVYKLFQKVGEGSSKVTTEVARFETV